MIHISPGHGRSDHQVTVWRCQCGHRESGMSRTDGMRYLRRVTQTSHLLQMHQIHPRAPS
jgi:hypothetical protein